MVGRTHVCRPSPKRLSRLLRGLLPSLPGLPLPDLSKSKRFGEFGTSLGVVRCDHRVVRPKTAFLPVLLGSEPTGRQVTLKGFVPAPVFEADDVVGLDRLLNRDWR